MKNPLLLLPFLFCNVALFSQSLEWVNFTPVDSPLDRSYPKLIATDPLGNVIVSQQIFGSVDIDPGESELVVGLEGSEEQTTVLSKLTSDGELIWALEFSHSNDALNWMDLEVDDQESIYLVGSIEGEVIYDPSGENITFSSTNEVISDALLVKISSDSSFEWFKTWGNGQYNAELTACSTHPIQAVSVAGHFDGVLDIDPNEGIVSVDDANSFLNRLSYDGETLGLGSLSGAESRINDIEYGPLAEMYVLGSFIDTLDIDPHLESSNEVFTQTLDDSDTDVFLAMLNSSGNFIWGKQFSSELTDNFFHLAVNDQSQVSIGGYTPHLIDINPSSQQNLLNNAYFIVRFQGLSGNYSGASVFNIQTDQIAEFIDLQLDNSGGEYILLSLQSTTDPDAEDQHILNSIHSDGSPGIFMNLEQENGFARASGIAIHNGAKLYLSGNYNGTIDFDPSEQVTENTSQFPEESFLLKLGICSIDNTVIPFSDGFFAQQQNADYQWLDCNDDFSPIIAETAISYVPQESGSYAVLISQEDCEAQSDCFDFSVNIEEIGNRILKIYPNPASEIINLESTPQNETYIIYNHQGQSIMSGVLHSDQINVSSLDPAIYVLEIDGERRVRFIVD